MTQNPTQPAEMSPEPKEAYHRVKVHDCDDQREGECNGTQAGCESAQNLLHRERMRNRIQHEYGKRHTIHEYANSLREHTERNRDAKEGENQHVRDES